MKSQNEEILEWLKAGNSITPLEALERFRCMRLGGRIYELKKAGHPITSEMIETPSGKHIARYKLAA